MTQDEIEDFLREIIKNCDLDQAVFRIKTAWIEDKADARQEGVVAGQMSAWNNGAY